MRRLLCIALLLTATRSLAGQVGYDPLKSPYRPIEHGSWLELYSGHMFGSGGPIPVGPRDGNVYGGRIDFRGQHVLQLSLGGWVSTTQRYIIDANDSLAKRITGPVSQRVIAGEVNIQFNITGGKTYRGLAPYVAVSIGLAGGQNSPARDTSGYSFGSKMYATPAIGTRYFVGERLFVKVEAATTVWKIKYPTTYSVEPVKQPGTIDHPNAVNPTGRISDYVLAPQLHVGIGWAF